ncbi:MAG: anthranilate synthase component I family protein, partial [Elusimicrobia bacterium]|nr:anthranilate synthase component I family protein [Elusimicrobiota bacterium]
VPGLPRFWGGAVGYFGYDMVRFFESLPTFLEDDLKVPDASFQLTDQLLVFDRFSQTIKVVVCVSVDGWGKTPFPRPHLVARSYREACSKIERTLQTLQRSQGVTGVGGWGSGEWTKGVRISSNLSPHGFVRAIQRAKRYITNGDAIQVVLSQRFSTQVHTPPFDIYRALRLVNPSPYMYFLRFRDLYLIGSSPEILVRKEGEVVETRPIAGTRPRGRSPQEDLALERALLSDPKERAEHLMLVDLGRNDLGRVCRVGSIHIPEFMSVERYSHVMHLVSSVTGRLAHGRDVFDLLAACFPAGTVTGAPKIRAMQIIEELEPVRRGPYAGAVGYFSFSGNLDMAITIRTILLKDGVAYVQAGAGIVADSLPRRELQETRNKAAALFEAVRRAEQNL